MNRSEILSVSLLTSLMLASSPLLLHAQNSNVDFMGGSGTRGKGVGSGGPSQQRGGPEAVRRQANFAGAAQPGGLHAGDAAALGRDPSGTASREFHPGNYGTRNPDPYVDPYVDQGTSPSAPAPVSAAAPAPAALPAAAVPAAVPQAETISASGQPLTLKERLQAAREKALEKKPNRFTKYFQSQVRPDGTVTGPSVGGKSYAYQHSKDGPGEWKSVD